MTTITMPTRDTPKWKVEDLKRPEMREAFEKATRLKIRREKLLRKHPFCRYCGTRLSAKSATLDHVTPEAQGGTDDAGNLVLACLRCNQCKAGRTPLEWVTDILTGGMRTS